MVTPTLNAPVQHYERFAGRYNEQMPRLLAAGYQPISMAHAMQKRLEIQCMPAGEVRDALLVDWSGSYHDVADGNAYNGNRIKIVIGAKPLITITPESPSKDGALVITPDTYAQLGGQEFTRSGLEKAGINRWLPLKRVKVHPVWQALAGDQKLLDDYSAMVFDTLKTREAMGVYLAGNQDLALRAWYLAGVGGGGRSLAGGRFRLANDVARLVGVRAVASEASAPKEATLERRI